MTYFMWPPCMVLACLPMNVAFEFALPSGVHVPRQVQKAVGRSPVARAAERALGSRVPDRVSEQIQDMLLCCRAFSAECLACAADQDVMSFCATKGNQLIPGCDDKLQAAEELSREQSLNGVLGSLANRASQLDNDEAQQLADDYLDKHPTVAHTSVADMASETFKTISFLKSSIWEDLGHSNAVGADELDSTGVRTSDQLKAPYPKHLKTDSSSIFFQNPWVVVVCALLVTAVCSGVAVGALVRARVQARAQEPLLSTLLQDVAAKPARQTETA